MLDRLHAVIDRFNDPALTLETKCAICNHELADHYTIYSGKVSGCAMIEPECNGDYCSCEGFTY
jgi:hypothetical protein